MCVVNGSSVIDAFVLGTCQRDSVYVRDVGVIQTDAQLVLPACVKSPIASKWNHH